MSYHLELVLMKLGSLWSSLVLNLYTTPIIRCPDLTIFVKFSHKYFNYFNISQGGGGDYFGQTELLCGKVNVKIVSELLSSSLLPWQLLKIARTRSFYQYSNVA